MQDGGGVLLGWKESGGFCGVLSQIYETDLPTRLDSMAHKLKFPLDPRNRRPPNIKNVRFSHSVH